MLIIPFIIIYTVLAEVDGELLYSVYCAESGYLVDCNTLIPNFEAIIFALISMEIAFLLIYLKYGRHREPKKKEIPETGGGALVHTPERVRLWDCDRECEST